MDLSLKTIVTKFLLIIKSFSTLNDSRNLQSLQLKKKKEKLSRKFENSNSLYLKNISKINNF